MGGKADTPIDIVFVVPVRHHLSVANWHVVKQNLAETLRSIAGQTSDNWECRVVANEGADLPSFPPRCSARLVDLPLPSLPDKERNPEAFYDAVRRDKGLRVYEGMRDVDPMAYVMVVDFDDYVSRRVAAFAGQRANASGWFLGRGYVYGMSKHYFIRDRFNHLCGTSLIVRRDKLRGLETPTGKPDEEKVKRWLGSHRFIADDLDAKGIPLQPLPFPGAIYRIANPQSTSGATTLFREMNPRWLLRKAPAEFLLNLLKYRRMNSAIAEEFSVVLPVGLS